MQQSRLSAGRARSRTTRPDSSARTAARFSRLRGHGDYFAVFSLVPRLNLDLGMLEHEFHKLSRKLHPDRFARASSEEKEWSLADTALLNDAYRTLRDPIRRTEYLLKLQGAEIGEESTAAEEESQPE